MYGSKERVYTDAERLYSSPSGETQACEYACKTTTTTKILYNNPLDRRESVYTNAKRLYNNPSDETINLTEAKRSPTHVKDPVVHVKSSRDSVRKHQSNPACT